MYRKLSFFILAFLAIITVSSQDQEIFNLDFEEAIAPDDWSVTSKSEWCHLIGEDGSSYFRFHPTYLNDRLESPKYDLEAGNYVFYFSWNEVNGDNPNYARVRIKKNNRSWEDLYFFGGSETGGTDRVWRKDSVVLSDLEDAEYTIQIRYNSEGRYPSQYIGLDNISLVKKEDAVTSTNILEKVDAQIFPNPASEVLQLQIETTEVATIAAQIFAVDGSLMKTIPNVPINAKHEIDVAELAAGNYVLKLLSNTGSKSIPFIIQ